MLADAPERDRPEIERMIASHGGAIVLRVGDKLGSEAGEVFVAYKKANDYEEPPHDFVWIGSPTLGWDASAAVVDGAGSVTRSGLHETVGERQGRQPAQELRRLRAQMRLTFWWGGVMVGAGCAFALKHGWWPSWAALIAFGLLFTAQTWRSL
jgi:hypothetical protein